MTEDILLLSTFILTTSIAVLAGFRLLGLPRVSVLNAINQLMEWAGAVFFFLAINLLLGVALTLLVRLTTTQFVSPYSIDVAILVIVSAVQGFVFRLLWLSK